MDAAQHDGKEVGYVLWGRLTRRIGEAEHVLGPGDSFAFPVEPASQLPQPRQRPDPDHLDQHPADLLIARAAPGTRRKTWHDACCQIFAAFMRVN